jgi:hypothetical protein
MMAVTRPVELMAATNVSLDEVVVQALQLSALDKVRLIERVVAVLEQDLAAPEGAPLLSAHGILAHLGPAPSAEEIDEARREAWGTFPREDIA